MKKLTLTIILLLVPLLFMSCDIFDLRNRVYTGEKLVEFYPPEGATVDEIDEASGDTVVVVKPKINLISPEGLAQRDLQIPFTVGDSETTAVQGTHYNIITSSPLTIAKGTTSTKMQIEITANGLQPDETKVLFITLQGTDIVKPAANYKTFRIIIRGAPEDADNK